MNHVYVAVVKSIKNVACSKGIMNLGNKDSFKMYIILDATNKNSLEL
ncbi:hypothetical protein IEC_05395 [Bacillus toyonensis]|nr:hypothetical protein IEC_05395 [Bacillus toyonensis]